MTSLASAAVARVIESATRLASDPEWTPARVLEVARTTLTADWMGLTTAEQEEAIEQLKGVLGLYDEKQKSLFQVTAR